MKIQVVRQFLFERASFVVEMLDDMVAQTSKTKRPNAKKTGPRQEAAAVLQRADADDGMSDELSTMEEAMNSNARLHPPLAGRTNVDTRISACKHCGKRLLNFYTAVHCHEYHSGPISNDVCDGVTVRLKGEAAY